MILQIRYLKLTKTSVVYNSIVDTLTLLQSPRFIHIAFTIENPRISQLLYEVVAFGTVRKKEDLYRGSYIFVTQWIYIYIY